MKFCRLYSLTLLWYFEQLYLPVRLAFPESVESIGVEEKGDVSIPNPGSITAYKKSHVFVSSTDSTGKGSVVVLDSEVVEQLKSKLFIDNVLHSTVHVAPDNTFEFPALIIAGTITHRFASTALTVVNVNNFLAPSFHEVVDKAARHGGNPYSFGNPAWISKDECFICRSVRVAGASMASNKIMLFKKDPAFYSWTSRAISQMKCSYIHVFKKIYREVNSLFVIDQMDNALKMIWYDEDAGAPDWADLTRVKSVSLVDDAPVTDMKFADANYDGEIDMLVAVATYEGEVRAYQVPRNRNFKHYYEYTWFLIVGDFKSVEGKSFCPGALKSFFPYDRYAGKPWVLVSGGECGKVVYLVPDSNDPEIWTYKKYLILEGSERIDGFEVVDINDDGFAEVFVSIGKRDIVRIFSFSESVPSKPDVFVASNATLNSSFQVDTTAPSFSGSSGLLVNYMAFVISLCSFSFQLF